MPKDVVPSEQEALSRAQALCSRREYCVSEIREKLVRWQQSAEAQERILAQLQAERYIDEVRFCRAYALEKMRYNHWGRAKIDQMLRLLRVDERARRLALDNLPDEEYIGILRRVLQAKLPSVRARNDYERRGKLVRFLLGRGFEMDLIRDMLDEP